MPPSPAADAMARLVTTLRDARAVVILTGAGVSAESGIPTFRDAMSGQWAKYDPQELATPEAFARDPAKVSRWYDERRVAALACRPNAGHVALAALERALRERGGQLTLLTQNVDQLHQRAGSQDVVELHGSIVRWRCTKTGQTQLHERPEPLAATYPLPSPAGGLWRPDVVWFHEPLPEHALARADEACHRADLYMAIGTSGVVYPATGLVQIALQRQIPTVEINPTSTPVSDAFAIQVREASGTFLPALVAQAFG